MKKVLCGLLALMLVASMGCFAVSAEEEAPAEGGEITLGSGYDIMTTVKLLGIGWFDRTETMVKEFGENTGNNCYQTGPSEADAAATNQLLEDAIATGVDAICIIPFAPASADPVLAKAREQGIVVISHEATDQVECDYDIEAFDNYAYGAILMDYLAEGMEEEQEYSQADRCSICSRYIRINVR